MPCRRWDGPLAGAGQPRHAPEQSFQLGDPRLGRFAGGNRLLVAEEIFFGSRIAKSQRASIQAQVESQHFASKGRGARRELQYRQLPVFLSGEAHPSKRR